MAIDSDQQVSILALKEKNKQFVPDKIDLFIYNCMIAASVQIIMRMSNCLLTLTCQFLPISTIKFYDKKLKMHPDQFNLPCHSRTREGFHNCHKLYHIDFFFSSSLSKL